MDFEEYLLQKKIDSQSFKLAETERWRNFKKLFEQMHPNSFTMQKLNVINSIRRQYPLKESVEQKLEKPKQKRPVIRPKQTK